MSIPPVREERKLRDDADVKRRISARMIAPWRGTPIAASRHVRSLFLAWLTFALLLFALGGLSRVQ